MSSSTDRIDLLKEKNKQLEIKIKKIQEQIDKNKKIIRIINSRMQVKYITFKD
jgi:hypothetical protein